MIMILSIANLQLIIGGPELLGRSSAEDQLYIRAFAAIASSPEEVLQFGIVEETLF